MKKTIFLCGLMFVLLFVLNANQEKVLPEIFNPSSINVVDNSIYITQGVEVFIYSKGHLKLNKKFGKAGAGPKEFIKRPGRGFPSIHVFFRKDEMLISSQNKMSFYTKDGEFIREDRINGNFFLLPLKEKFVNMQWKNENGVNYIGSEIIDKKYTNNKFFLKFKIPDQRGDVNDPLLAARTPSYYFRLISEDKFVTVDEDNRILVFDSTGKALAAFRPDYTKRMINKKLEGSIDELLSSDLRYKQHYGHTKKDGETKISDAMPVFKNYRIDGNRICVISNHVQNGKFETFIYDFKGKLIKKIYLPLIEADLLNFFPFTIKDSNIYQLIIEEEQVKLRITKI